MAEKFDNPNYNPEAGMKYLATHFEMFRPEVAKAMIADAKRKGVKIPPVVEAKARRAGILNSVRVAMNYVNPKFPDLGYAKLVSEVAEAVAKKGGAEGSFAATDIARGSVPAFTIDVLKEAEKRLTHELSVFPSWARLDRENKKIYDEALRKTKLKLEAIKRLLPKAKAMVANSVRNAVTDKSWDGKRLSVGDWVRQKDSGLIGRIVGKYNNYLWSVKWRDGNDTFVEGAAPDDLIFMRHDTTAINSVCSRSAIVQKALNAVARNASGLDGLIADLDSRKYDSIAWMPKVIGPGTLYPDGMKFPTGLGYDEEEKVRAAWKSGKYASVVLYKGGSKRGEIPVNAATSTISEKALNAARNADTPEGRKIIERAKGRFAAIKDPGQLANVRDDILRGISRSSAIPDDAKDALEGEVIYLHGQALRKLGFNAVRSCNDRRVRVLKAERLVPDRLVGQSVEVVGGRGDDVFVKDPKFPRINIPILLKKGEYEVVNSVLSTNAVVAKALNAVARNAGNADSEIVRVERELKRKLTDKEFWALGDYCMKNLGRSPIPIKELLDVVKKASNAATSTISEKALNAARAMNWNYKNQYQFFCVDPSMKAPCILSGWDYREDAKDDAAELKELGIPHKIVSRRFLEQHGIGPNDGTSWKKNRG